MSINFRTMNPIVVMMTHLFILKFKKNSRCFCYMFINTNNRQHEWGNIKLILDNVRGENNKKHRDRSGTISIQPKEQEIVFYSKETFYKSTRSPCIIFIICWMLSQFCSKCQSLGSCLQR